jgi:hypothetical protein
MGRALCRLCGVSRGLWGHDSRLLGTPRGCGTVCGRRWRPVPLPRSEGRGWAGARRVLIRVAALAMRHVHQPDHGRVETTHGSAGNRRSYARNFGGYDLGIFSPTCLLQSRNKMLQLQARPAPVEPHGGGCRGSPGRGGGSATRSDGPSAGGVCWGQAVGGELTHRGRRSVSRHG